MKTIILSIGGMSCSACSNGIEKYLNKQNGIFDAKVNLVMANATITYDEKILDIPKIEKYIEKSGYKSLGLFKNFNVEKKKKNEKLFFVIFTIFAIILMYISMGHMINLPLPEILEPHKSSKIYFFICKNYICHPGNDCFFRAVFYFAGIRSNFSNKNIHLIYEYNYGKYVLNGNIFRFFYDKSIGKMGSLFTL